MCVLSMADVTCARSRCPDNETMAKPTSRPWGLYLTTFLTAMFTAVSAVYWVLSALGVSQQRTPSPALLPLAAAPDPQRLARALGGGVEVAAKSAPTPTTQYQLLGVVAGPVGKGYALLVVGNAPPKTFAVGASVGDGQVLQSVSPRGAKLGSSLRGEALAELSLPKPAGD